MRSALATILASLFLFSSTELHQFVKLPELIQHFQQHRKADPAMDLFAFLQLHYTANHPEDNDDDDDMELPFKELKATGHVDTVITMNRTDHRSCPEFPVIIEPITHPEGMPRYRSNAVFHPPKA